MVMDASDTLAHHFRLNCIRVLTAASPALAALHASRAARVNSQALSPLHCPRCGRLGLTTRLARSRHPGKARGIGKGKSKSRSPIAPRNNNSSPSESAPTNATTEQRTGCTRLWRTCPACGFRDAQALPVATPASLKARLPKSGSVKTNALAGHIVATHNVAATLSEPVRAELKMNAMHVDVEVTPSAPSRQASADNVSAQSSTPARVSPVDPPHDVNSSAKAPSQPSSSSSSRRPKKKTGLQEMLARSREQKDKKKDNDVGSGLAAFLSGL